MEQLTKPLKKLFCVIGTRPQLIKHSILVQSLKSYFNIETLNSTQHYQHELNDQLMQDLFLNLPITNLNMDPSFSSAKRLGAMIQGIDQYLQQSQPDAVLVYGDTDTTLAGALAAYKNKFKLIHIEAGERSYNKNMPEETNRIIADQLSDLLFCASLQAINNLQKENNQNLYIYSGDVMKDLLLQKASCYSEPLILEEYIYCTLHRNYNQNNLQKIKEIIDVLCQLPYIIIFPVHPATRKSLREIGIKENIYKNIRFLEPLTYGVSINYQKFAEAVITDSGGIQKEAYWLKRPCITIRKETEWTDTLTGKWNQLLYDDLNELPLLLQKEQTLYDANLYGNGQAGRIICENILNHL
jgi:UDP-GlcNAc3NAcA epimerase